jgi:beta-glucosidase
MDEVYDDDSPGNIKSVLTTFDCSIDAVLDIITGRFTPAEKMPFTTPQSEPAAQNKLSDLLGYMEKKADTFSKKGYRSRDEKKLNAHIYHGEFAPII